MAVAAPPKKYLVLTAVMLTAPLLIIQTALLAAGGPATSNKRSFNSVQSLSYSRDKRSEKIIIFLDREVSYKARTLDKNHKSDIPFRLYLDLLNTRLQKKISRIYPAPESNIKTIRIAQRDKQTTRIVLDLKKKIYRNDYQIRQFEKPPKLIIELFPTAKTSPHPPKTTAKIAGRPKPADKKAKFTARQEKPQQSKQTMPSPPEESDTCVIVVDPGHGGKDPGAIGYRGINEKDVCLPIALELKKLLDQKPNCKTILTRSSDKFLSLENRAEIANSNKATLFISIHANSHEDASLAGIETYYLNFSSDTSARRVAARENFTTPSRISDLELILFDLLQSGKINKSSIFAGYMHNALVKKISAKYKNLRNLGVKHAPMRVLIDAEMPGVLIETAFISNPSDAKRLKSRSYQKLLAQAILEGISNYTNGQKTAYYRNAD